MTSNDANGYARRLLGRPRRAGASSHSTIRRDNAGKTPSTPAPNRCRAGSVATEHARLGADRARLVAGSDRDDAGLLGFPDRQPVFGLSTKDYGLWYQVGLAVRQGLDIYPRPETGRLFPFMYPPSAAAMLAWVSILGPAGSLLRWCW